VSEPKDLTKLFESNRSHLRGVAYRMLGSASEADDAVQEACDAERHLRQPHSAQPGGALFRLECAKDNGKTNSLVFSGNIDYLVKF